MKHRGSLSYFLSNSPFPLNHGELISVGILFLLPHLVTIFVFLQVAEYPTTIAREVLAPELSWEEQSVQNRMRERRQVGGLFLQDTGESLTFCAFVIKSLL